MNDEKKESEVDELKMCKLCKDAVADKTNSHIVPKWMGKTMLDTGNGNKGFLIDTANTHLPRKQSQDTDKEDYILCSSCEEYFGLIESWFKRDVHDQLHGTPSTKNHELKHNGLGVKWAEFHDPKMIRLARLFYYSIIWRTSICSVKLWETIQLPAEQEEYFRKILLDCKSNKKVNLIELLPNIVLKDSPWFMNITCTDIKLKTRNLLGGFPTIFEVYRLFLNEHTLTVSFPPNEAQKKFEIMNNESEDEILKIALVDDDFWSGQIDHHVKMMEESAIENLKESGNTYYSKKKKK